MRNDHRCTRRALLFAGGFGALALAACTAPPAPTAAPKSAPPTTAPAKPTAADKPAAPAAKPVAATAAPATKTTLSWKQGIIIPRFNAAFQYLPRDKGFFKEQGVDVDFQEVGSDVTLLQGVLAGEFDGVEIGPQAMIASVEQGSDVKIVGAYDPGLPAVFVVEKDVNQLADLYGRPVGINGVGGFVDFLVQAMFLREGADRSKTEIVSISDQVATNQALVAGKIAGSYVSVDAIPQMEQSGHLKVLYDISDKVPEVIRFAIICSQKAIADKSEALTRYLVGYGKGIRYFIDNKSETLKFAVEATKTPEDQAARAYDYYVQKKLLQPNAYIDPKTLTAFQELNQKLGFQKTVMPPEKVATWDFQKKVVAALGPYPGFPS